MSNYTLWLIEKKRSLPLKNLVWGIPITIGLNATLFIGIASAIREVQPVVVADIPIEIVVLEEEKPDLPKPELIEPPPPEPQPVAAPSSPAYTPPSVPSSPAKVTYTPPSVPSSPAKVTYTPPSVPSSPAKATYTPPPALFQPPAPKEQPRMVQQPEERKPTPLPPAPPVMTSTTEPEEEAPAPFVPLVSSANQTQEPESQPGSLTEQPAPVAKAPPVEALPAPVVPKVESTSPPPETPKPEPVPEAVLPKETKPYVPEEEKPREDGKVTCVSCEKPSFPAGAKERGLQGQVRLSIDVAPSGVVEDVRLLTSSGHPELDQAAMEQVKRWRFTTSTQGKKGLSARINFELIDRDRRAGTR